MHCRLDYRTKLIHCRQVILRITPYREFLRKISSKVLTSEGAHYTSAAGTATEEDEPQCGISQGAAAIAVEAAMDVAGVGLLGVLGGGQDREQWPCWAVAAGEADEAGE